MGANSISVRVIDASGDAAHANVSVPITRCGDGSCTAGEAIETCPTDCGGPAVWDESNWDHAVWQ